MLVKTANAYPTGTLAEICGERSPCVTVPVGVPTPDLAAVPLTATATLDKRWLRKDIMRASTDVRILSASGEVLAEGVGAVQWPYECCASTEITFAG